MPVGQCRHDQVVCLVAWPSSEIEAVVLIQTFLL